MKKRFSFPFIQALIVFIVLVSNTQMLAQVHARGVYDFIDDSNARQAVWQSGSGNVTFPGSVGDPRGYALILSSANLEDESQYSNVLETHPEVVSNGYIMGTYPSRTILPDERLIIEIGFLSSGYSVDGADYQVRFVDSSGTLSTLISVHADYDGRLDKYTVDLSAYAGKVGKFVLYVSGGSDTENDNTVWTEAYCEQVTAADLKVDSIWLSNGLVHYKFSNVGVEALGSPGSPVEFTNILEVNDIQASTDTVTLYLQPGQTVERTFNMRWQLATPDDTVRVTLDIYNDVPEVNENNNVLESMWHIVPDLNPAKITWTPASPSSGQAIDLVVAVKNLGNMTTQPCYGELSVNGVLVRNVSIPSVIPWSYANVSFNWGPVSLGENKLVFNVDSSDLIAESNEKNNVIQATVIGSSQPPPIANMTDLSAEGLTWRPSPARTNKMVTFTPLVSNLGEVDSPTCKLKLLANGTLIGTVLIPPIPAKKSLADVGNITINWIPIKVGNYVLEEIIDSDNVVNESNKTNNQMLSQIHVVLNDETLPKVKISITPENPTELTPVNFEISSYDVVGVSSISLYINNTEVKRVENSTILTQTLGPYKVGTVIAYWVKSVDNFDNVYNGPHYNLTISSSIPIDGKVTASLTPPAPSAADEISVVVANSFGGNDLKLYINDTLNKEAFNQSNLTVNLGRLHAGSVLSYYAEAFSAGGEASRTPTYYVTVKKALVQISISFDNNVIPIGDSAELRGVVSSDDPQLSINLTYSKNGTVVPVTVHPDSGGQFSDEFKPSDLGVWEVVASVNSNQDYLSSESQMIKLTVNPQFFLFTTQGMIVLGVILLAAVMLGFYIFRRKGFLKKSS
ncbi:MAG: CARDB domain-containing protein [Candidatus Bathyarchaeia archaeon]